MNRRPPLVSIVIPAYNGNAFLQEAIASALSQSHRNIEIIVGDDCSQEDTKAVTERFDDSRIIYYRNEANLGLTSNLNKAIQVSRGEYICWLNQDDVFYPRKLELQLRELSQNARIGACFCEKDDIDAAGEVMQRYNPSKERIPVRNQLLQLFGGCYLTAPTVMIPSRVLADVGLFNDCYQIAFDYDMWFRIRQRYEFRVLNQPLIAFRHHSANLSAEINAEVVNLEAAAIISAALRRIDLGTIFPQLRPHRDEQTHDLESASCLLVLARLIWSQQSWSRMLVAEVLGLVAEAIRLNPDLLGAYELALELARFVRNSTAEREYEKKWRLKCDEYRKGVGSLRIQLRRNCRSGVAAEVARLLRITPASGDPYFQLASMQAECGQSDDARGNCQLALETNPEHEGAQQMFATLQRLKMLRT